MIKELNENLCTIAGIHAADGHLNRRGGFSVKDEDRENIKILADLIKEEFYFSPKISKSYKENSYQIQFMRKSFWKYLNDIFKFPLGPKTKIVKMPSIINTKPLKRAFIKGLFTFESSVNINKSITFSVISKQLRDDLVSFFKEDNLNISLTETVKGGNRELQYGIRSPENLKKKELEKWLKYYIKGSEKWFKILELSNGFFGKVKNIKNAKDSFRLTYFKGRKIKIYDLIDTIKKLKQTDINYIYKKLGLGKTTIMKYLHLLANSKIIKMSKMPVKLNLSNLSRNTHITLKKKFRENLFERVNRYHGHDAEICRKLGIKDFVYCKWRNGERGISLDKIKILSKLARIKETYLNIKKVDRRIIAFNEKIGGWRVPWRPWIRNVKLDKNNQGVKKWIIKS